MPARAARSRICRKYDGRGTGYLNALSSIRHARDADIGTIAGIYAHHVRTGTASFEEVPPSTEEMLRRFRAVQEAGLPFLVAEAGGEVAGYAYAGNYHTRSAYRYALEDSVYIAPERQRLGLGRRLVGALIRLVTAQGYRQMLALIGDSANTASIGLHRCLGFRHIGCQSAVGLKFGRWLDVVQMQLPLGPGEGDIPIAPPGNRNYEA